MAGTHVALLRGINVGKAKRVAMADLRTVFAGLGHRDVRTLLNSGNVLFTASGKAAPAALADGIERAIESRLRVSSRVTVLSARELGVVIDENPLVGEANEPSRLFVAVPRTTADCRRFDPLTRMDWSPDALAIGTRAAYFWCPHGMLESRLPKAIGRALGDAVTTRNWATMSKLQPLVGGVRS
jgi:uncharacterized protein (DUF1697 family)